MAKEELNIIDLETLQKTYKVETEDEKHKKNVKEYINYIARAIVDNYRCGMTYATIKTNEDLYDSYKLKKELKAKGYKVELHKMWEQYYGCEIPYELIIRW